MAQRLRQHPPLIGALTALLVVLSAAPGCSERSTGPGRGSPAQTTLSTGATTSSAPLAPEPAMTVFAPLGQDIADPSADAVGQYLDLLDQVEKKARADLSDFAVLPDGAGVKAESEKWTALFLSDAASPSQPGLTVRRSAHRAEGDLPDVLRQEYDLSFEQGKGLPKVTVHLVLEETVSWIRIRPLVAGLDLRATPVAARLSWLSWLASRVLRLQGTHRGRADEDAPHTWVFHYKDVEEGARFSTDASQTLFVMWSWADRVDGGIRGGQPYFLGFKHIEPASGKLISLNPDHWFDGKCWDTYRRR